MTRTLHRPLVVAHRGDLEHCPENTLAAFARAIAGGADALELDVFLTHDGELVVHHDHTLGRTTNGSGFVGDFTLAALRRLDAGSWFASGFAGERIPTLGEVLALGSGRVRFELELRTPTRAFLERLFTELDRFGVAADVELTSPHLPLLAAAHALRPDLRSGLFVAPFPPWLPAKVAQQHVCENMALLGATVAHLPLDLLEPTLVDRLHDAGLMVHAAGVNTEAALETVRTLGFRTTGVDQLSTDRLELVRRAVAGWS